MILADSSDSHEQSNEQPQANIATPLLEDVLIKQSSGRYSKDEGKSSSIRYQEWDQEQRGLDRAADRDETKTAKDFSRSRKRDILWVFLFIVSLTTVLGLATFWSPNAEDRKIGISAAVSAMSAIGGLAAGMGLQ
jgi:hypothetical protein